MESGNIFQLMRYMIKCNDFEATRLLQRYGKESEKSFEERMAETAKKEEWVEWNPDLLTKFREALYKNPDALNYLEQRGFSRDTIRHFDIGLSEYQQMVTIPVHSPSGLCVGIVGRSVKDKCFKNSSRLPNTRLLYNYHRAKACGDIVIVTESAFDTMRVHQAGFPNVVGTLGGYMNAERYALLDRTFKTIIIMTDDDKLQFYPGCKKCDKRGFNSCAGHNPGRMLGMSIAENMRNKRVLWASAGYKQNYVNGAKDAGDMTDLDIAKCVNGAVSHLEYLSWGLHS